MSPGARTRNGVCSYYAPAFFGAAGAGLGLGVQAAYGAFGGFIGGANGSLFAQLLLEGDVDFLEAGLDGLLGLGIGASNIGLLAYSASVGYVAAAEVVSIEIGVGICGGTADVLFSTVRDELEE